MPEENKPTANRSAAKQGYAAKAAWMRTVTRDSALSARAKLVAHVAAWELAGSKGYFKATHRRLADLTGESLSAVRRAIAELDSQNYWNTETTTGDCNVYHLITPEGRLAIWQRAELAYRHECESWAYAERVHKKQIGAWLDAERRFHEQRKVAQWLDAEAAAKKAFIRAVTESLTERGAGTARAAELARKAWTAHCQGTVSLGVLLAGIADMDASAIVGPTDNFEQGSLDSEQGSTHHCTDPCSQVSRPLLNSNALTSEEGNSHKYFKSFKDVEVPQAAAAGAHARPFAAQEPPAPTNCTLCDSHGLFLDVDGEPVVVLSEDGNDEIRVQCQHSFAANLEEIRQIENSQDGDWGVARTGWSDIDCHYSYLANSVD
ncbi:hypothetical protein [Mycobacteroides abscessus]|uniref:hypothetical protein n=1 Tax=Mycobacteroides abscessus TaxID=36809 RepID=UPI0011C3F805|nr:hypothetical protein [Mycobacteroides abscessus]